jgi:DEAD/DEAH box helicase domain-containing protein
MNPIAPIATDPLLDLLADLASEGQIVHVERLPERLAEYGATAQAIDSRVLEAFGAPRLWSHQAQAIDAVRAGRSVVVATGTASGKSLCYQLPIAEAALTNRATAMLLFPTKALAQDQLRALSALRLDGLEPATYDGDTSTEARTWIRRRSNIILTNPEMLHHGILPSHARWAGFLRRLEIIVVDELHVLRGVFGSHVAHLLRRLQRLCTAYGSSPVFVFTSATIGEPATLARALCGHDVTAITDDASPCGERLVVCWNPPLIDPDNGIRASAANETARLLTALVASHTRTVAFCRSRRTTERVAASVRQRLTDDDETAALVSTVRPYRSGYLPSERREIEAELSAWSQPARWNSVSTSVGSTRAFSPDSLARWPRCANRWAGPDARSNDH